MTMKKLLTLLVAAALLAVSPMAANAGDSTWQAVFGSYNTGDATDNEGAFLAFGGTVGFTGQIPVIRTLNVTSDKAGAVLTLRAQNGDSTTTDAAYSSGGKILPVTATTSFEATDVGAGSWIAIKDNANKKFEINRVSSITSGASLNLVRNTVNTYASGSTVYELESLGTIAVGNATVTQPAAFLVGQSGEVLAWTLDGTSACSINYIAGEYVSAQGK